MKDLAEIRTAIVDRYRSLESPNFFFVQETDQSKPFADLNKKLSDVFTVSDETDLNNDHCQTLVLRKSSKNWLLQLSYVGPYAILMRLSRWRGKAVLVEEFSQIDAEQSIAAAVTGSGLTFLPREVLETPIELRLFSTDPENTCYYQALFSDLDILPWEA